MAEEAGTDIDIWISVIRIELFNVGVYHVNVLNEGDLLLFKASGEGGPRMSKFEEFNQTGRRDSTNIDPVLVDQFELGNCVYNFP